MSDDLVKALREMRGPNVWEAADRIEELEAENAKLAANQCEGPMVGDEFGNFYCLAIKSKEAESIEKSRLLGMGGERELALMARLSEAQRELAKLCTIVSTPPSEAMVMAAARNYFEGYGENFDRFPDLIRQGHFKVFSSAITAAFAAAVKETEEKCTT